MLFVIVRFLATFAECLTKNSTAMEGMLSFVSIIVIVFGILQIILFFKLWGMTDNIKHIKANLIDGGGISIDAAKKEFMSGNTDKAFEIYNKCFINDTLTIYNEIMYIAGSVGINKEGYETKYKENCKIYQKLIAKLGTDYSIDFSRFETLDKVKYFMS